MRAEPVSKCTLPSLPSEAWAKAAGPSAASPSNDSHRADPELRDHRCPPRVPCLAIGLYRYHVARDVRTAVAGAHGALLLAQADSPFVLSDVKLALLDSLAPEHPVVVLQHLGLPDERVTALELAENLLVVGRTDEVPAICRTLIDRFTRAGMGGSAMTALAFLRETVATGHATPALVRHVHEFLRDVSRNEASSPGQPVLRLEE